MEGSKVENRELETVLTRAIRVAREHVNPSSGQKRWERASISRMFSEYAGLLSDLSWPNEYASQWDAEQALIRRLKEE